GVPVAVTPLAAEDVPLLARAVDLLIVTPEEVSNRGLVQFCSYVERPVVLSRGTSSLADEWLQTADDLLGRGNRQLILAAGGIRTFETATARTFDLSMIPLVKRRSHLPVLADLTGLDAPEAVLRALALAAIAGGADGVILAVSEDDAEPNGTFGLAGLNALLPLLRRLANRLH
ncbi:MAG: 3-deoxy-7-phosphoheptulonate synthase, partial [Dehalococcoidia bacterium]